jgi:hypothetical protein
MERLVQMRNEEQYTSYRTSCWTTQRGAEGTPSADEWAWRMRARHRRHCIGFTSVPWPRGRGEERHRVWRREDPNLQQNSGGLWLGRLRAGHRHHQIEGVALYNSAGAEGLEGEVREGRASSTEHWARWTGGGGIPQKGRWGRVASPPYSERHRRRSDGFLSLFRGS